MSVKQLLDLSGRVAIVTGGSRGLGLQMAEALGEMGAKLALTARKGGELDAAVAHLAELGVEAKGWACDVGQPEQIPGVVDAILAEYGKIDILVNNAGAIPGGSLDDVDEAAWRAGWELKVYGYIGLMRHYLRVMKERRRGVIINIIGVGGEKLDAMYIAGGVGNAGLMALTRAIGGVSADFGVRVVGVNPGPVMTERIEVLGRKRAASLYGDESRWRESFAKMPFGRPASCEEIAATVVFLASDLSAYTSGTIVTIDGGLAHRSTLP